MEIGDIVNLKNICFVEGNIDHAYRKGRPCVFIGEDDEHMYFLPLSNTKKVKNKKGVFIEPNKDNNLLKTSHLNYKQLIIKPIAFYAVRAFIDKDTMYKIFVEMTKFFKEIRSENDSKVLELAHDFIDKSYCDADAPKSKGYRNKR